MFFEYFRLANRIDGALVRVPRRVEAWERIGVAAVTWSSVSDYSYSWPNLCLSLYVYNTLLCGE